MKHTDQYVVNGSREMSNLENAYATQSLLIGKLLGTSPWLLIDQEMIDHFAAATKDYQWIHVDQERAKLESPYKSTIAHGFLSIALIPKFLTDVLEVK